MTEYAPDGIISLYNAIHAGLPESINAGIVGDSAHHYGYHRGRNYVGSDDYSNQLADDKAGDGEAECALDLSWTTAGPQFEVSQRLLNAANDSRMYPIRSFFGSTDGRVVCGWDFVGGYPVTSDDSHLWHVHLSILRKYANDADALAPVADVIIGGNTPTPTPPTPAPSEEMDYMPSLFHLVNDDTGDQSYIYQGIASQQVIQSNYVAAIEKGYGIEMRRVNQYDWNAINDCFQKDLAKLKSVLTS